MSDDELQAAFAEYRRVPVDDIQYSHDLLNAFDYYRAGNAAVHPKWLPIENAPRDGSEVLLRSGNGLIANGLWASATSSPGFWASATSSPGFWAWPYVKVEPTHFMQLPDQQLPDQPEPTVPDNDRAGMSGWEHKDTWRKYGNNFLIEVSHHESKASEIDCAFGDGPHRWAIYAYVYPGHPRFKLFKGESMWQDAATALPMHGGPSFLLVHESKGVITSYQVGCDYSHYGDSHYTMRSANNWETFLSDANDLFDFLSEEPA